MIELDFYATEGCHLCDEAIQQLESYRLYSKTPFTILYRDIIDNDAWYEAYQNEIPVLVNSQNNKQLTYPFEFTALLNLLA